MNGAPRIPVWATRPWFALCANAHLRNDEESVAKTGIPEYDVHGPPYGVGEVMKSPLTRWTSNPAAPESLLVKKASPLFPQRITLKGVSAVSVITGPTLIAPRKVKCVRSNAWMMYA